MSTHSLLPGALPPDAACVAAATSSLQRQDHLSFMPLDLLHELGGYLSSVDCRALAVCSRRLRAAFQRPAAESFGHYMFLFAAVEPAVEARVLLVSYWLGAGDMLLGVLHNRAQVDLAAVCYGALEHGHEALFALLQRRFAAKLNVLTDCRMRLWRVRERLAGDDPDEE